LLSLIATSKKAVLSSLKNN